MAQLCVFGENDRHTYINKRLGEVKLGEAVQVAQNDWKHELINSSATFVVLGIPEDIGVRANGGIGGAHTSWQPFVRSFLNIQETKQLRGADIFLLGHFDCSQWLAACQDVSNEALRDYTGRIDDIVYPVIEEIVAAGKIPVIIGGGHNNAYPILKGTSLAKKKSINALNLDAHSDFRAKEGRHSGNGFRYAYNEEWLSKYAMLGLHRAYNSQSILNEMTGNADLLPLFWEDIFLKTEYSWEAAIQRALDHVNDVDFGVELDVDCLQQVLSSAATPVGIHMQQAMRYLYLSGLNNHAAYLHLPEGVSKRADGLEDPFTGKLLSYLVQAFMRGVIDRQGT